MRSNENSNQFNLIGENAPTWLVLGLLLVGTIGSVATAHLLIPPDLTIGGLKSWTSQTEHQEHAATPSPPGVRSADRSVDLSVDTPITAPTRSPITELVDPIVEESRSVKESDRQDDSSQVSQDTAVMPMPPKSDEEFTAQVNLESEESTVTKITEGDPEPTPMTPVSVATNAGTAVALAADNTTETQARIQSTADQTHDCAPLFDLQFNRGSIRPVNSDLGEQAARLSEWLRRHPKTKLLLEGHTDSSGSEELNLLISHRRARAVSTMLANAGVNQKQIVIRALGEHSPLEGIPSGSENNRRVSLRIQGAEACQQATSEGDTR